MKESHNNQWEKEFDQKFCLGMGDPCDTTQEEVKSFISRIREDAIKEERARLAAEVCKINILSDDSEYELAQLRYREKVIQLLTKE